MAVAIATNESLIHTSTVIESHGLQTLTPIRRYATRCIRMPKTSRWSNEYRWNKAEPMSSSNWSIWQFSGSGTLMEWWLPAMVKPLGEMMSGCGWSWFHGVCHEVMVCGSQWCLAVLISNSLNGFSCSQLSQAQPAASRSTFWTFTGQVFSRSTGHHV